MTAVLLALVTAVTYGLANYLGPLLTRRQPLAGVLLVGQAVGLALAGALLLLAGGAAPDPRHLVLGLLAGCANAAAIALVYVAAAIGPMSVVVPLGATGGVVPVLAAVATGERPSAVQLVGIPVAVVGVVLAAASRPPQAGVEESPAAVRPAHQHVARPTVLLTLASALCFGTFLTLFGAASDSGPPWAIFTSRTAVVACTVVFVLVRRPAVRLPGRAVGAAAVPGVLLVVGTAAYGEATTQGLISVVAVLATLAPVVTVGLAVVLLGERLVRRQQVGVGTALVGIVLLAGG